jgi:RNA polymerase sigma-70 factor (ECF subfamily)
MRENADPSNDCGNIAGNNPAQGESNLVMAPETETERDASDSVPPSEREVRCAQLVGSCLQGHPGDFAELFELTEPVVRRLVGRLSGDRDAVDDLVQETYLRAWRGLGQFKGTSRFSTWLFRIAVNVTQTWRSRRRPTLSLRETDERPTNSASEVGDDALLEAYARALDRLPPDLRATFVLHETEGLSYRDVAEALQCPIGTVMSRLHRARARILDEIGEQLEGLRP